MPYRDATTGRNKTAARRRRTTAEHQDIAPRLWPVANPGRRAAALRSLRKFCETYFPARFYRRWSADHLKVLATIEQAVRRGGHFALVMPRRSGKTAICEAAAIFAAVTGLQRYVLLIGANKAAALELFDSIKMGLQENDLLAADFPREVGPFRLLEGEARQCIGQRHGAKRTHIRWRQDHVVFATVPRSKASGCVIRAAGLTGRLRGMHHTDPAGLTVRPSLLFLDDPQTEESANSPGQVATREKLITAGILGLADARKPLAAIMPCTVIARADLADRFLDHKLHPEWQGQRTQMLRRLPERLDLWQQYRAIRADELAAGGDGSASNAFYAEHREEMDRGGEASWEEDFDPNEVSAIQHAMNWFLFRPAAFAAECQGEPLLEDLGEPSVTAEQILTRLNGRDRGMVPTACLQVTAHVDVHDELLYWSVFAWESDFTGCLIDYGTFPPQNRAYFALNDPRPGLSVQFPGRGKEGAIFAGLERLLGELAARQFRRDDGAALKIGRGLVDTGYQPAIVQGVLRKLAIEAFWTPSRGVGITAADRPFAEYQRRPGAQYGLAWRVPSTKGTRELRTLHVDVNWWKSFFHARLAIAQGDRGGITLFGRDPQQHRLLADHWTAEYRVRTEGRGRVVYQWKPRPDRPDNHWFDNAVAAAAAASVLGITLPGLDPGPRRRSRAPIRLSELQRKRLR